MSRSQRGHSWDWISTGILGVWCVCCGRFAFGFMVYELDRTLDRDLCFRKKMCKISME